MKHAKKTKVRGFAVLYASFVYMELIVRIFTCRPFWDWGLVFMLVFSLVPAIFGWGISKVFNKKGGFSSAIVVTSLMFLIYATQAVYHGFFGKYLIFFSFFNGGAEQIMGEGVLRNTFEALLRGIPVILLLALPIVFLCIFRERIHFSKRNLPLAAIYSAASVVLCVVVSLAISFLPSLKTVRSGSFDPNLSVGKFGLFYTEVLDAKYNVFGVEQRLVLEKEYVPEENLGPFEEDPNIDTSPNVMSIDFAALAAGEKNKTLQSMNQYFADKTPTNKNKYTGMYKGYNLITITAEGFSPYAIDPVLTPTLYKMSQEGFKFTNFYTPIWGVSTSDGEYAHCTGLLPKSGIWSFYRSGENNMPFCLGNMFSDAGYEKVLAYHNHTYDYYHRDISHPNMGYDYKGIGNGLEGLKNQWPRSDLEMIENTVDEYLSDSEPFHVYYMTVSGHLNYTKIGNSMAAKNWHLVKDLDCSEELKGYYACNIELDRAMEKLLEELNEAGVADKTVITITPDHYPYGLEKKDGDKYAVWREFLGHEVDTTFELYESSFILYCQGTKDAPTIDKYCYSVDILPTMLNLFGMEYDSRLLMGSDILSHSSQLVIFSDRSFITERGMYNAGTKTFTLFEDEEKFESEEEKDKYIKGYQSIVNNKFQISAKILETDYYGYLFDD